jgi:hypothetical protein
MKRIFIRIAAITVGMELLMATAIYTRGWPLAEPLFRLATIWELPTLLLHVPAIAALQSVGLCCGYMNSLVIGDQYFDVGFGSYAPMTLRGTLILS